MRLLRFAYGLAAMCVLMMALPFIFAVALAVHVWEHTR